MSEPITIYNIRGPNGSGKSTLARSLISGDPAAAPNREGVPGSPRMVDLTWYDSPTKKDPARRRSVEGYVSHFDDLEAIVVGSYRTACGGLDATPNFGTAFAAIDGAVNLLDQHGSHTQRAVVAEGVISSTVWGSWGDYAGEIMDRDAAVFAFVYLIPPLEVCLERIRERQRAAGGERPIKEELVADKIKAVRATREKALQSRSVVYDLDAELPAEDVARHLRAIIADDWVEPHPNAGYQAGVLARDRFRA